MFKNTIINTTIKLRTKRFIRSEAKSKILSELNYTWSRMEVIVKELTDLPSLMKMAEIFTSISYEIMANYLRKYYNTMSGIFLRNGCDGVSEWLKDKGSYVEASLLKIEISLKYNFNNSYIQMTIKVFSSIRNMISKLSTQIPDWLFLIIGLKTV